MTLHPPRKPPRAVFLTLRQPGRGINMGDGWETARKSDRPAVLELGPDGLVKVRLDGRPCIFPSAFCALKILDITRYWT